MSENTGAGGLTDLARMRAVASYDLFDPELADELRAVCRRTAGRVGVELAAVQAVLDTATATIATSGGPDDYLTPLGGAPNEFSMCPTVVLTGRPLIAGDLRLYPEFAGKPGVLTGLVRAYAGIPLTAATGEQLGSHCVLSPHAREFSAEDLEHLHHGADEVMAVLARYRVTPPRGR